MPGAMEAQVLRFLAAPDSGAFTGLALETFAYQYETCAPLRAWCDGVGKTPTTVRDPAALPFVPAAVFRELELCCGLPVAEFRTSGTSGTVPGRHLAPSLDPYRASALAWFRHCVLPEQWNLRTLVLAPGPDPRPFSSLSRMFGWILETCAETGSGFFVGERGLEADRLAEALLDAARGGIPVLVAGTSAALLAFLDYCDASGVAVALPGGSRLMDTGGQKGSGRAVPLPLGEFQAGLYRRVAERLGIPRERCVNEYGMTELSSQFYDRVLLDRLTGEAAGFPRVKTGPPWVQTYALDPVTLAPLPAGATGLLAHVDLANVGSVVAVATEDFGRVVEGGLILEGRPREAEARGCGLTFGELLIGNR